MKKAFDIIQKIIYIITNIIIIFLLIIWLYYIFQVHVNKANKEEAFSHTLFIVNTGSMEDTIGINDIILVERTKNIEENDIIAFKQDGIFIVHRIVNINQDEIVTKGDANNQVDKPIKYEQVIGKVIGVVPIGFVILIIILIIGFNILLSFLEKYIDRNTNKEERRKTKNEE